MNGSSPNMAWRLTSDGAFICGDKRTGVTAYAYPTSEHAHNAKRHARRTAEAMLKAQNDHTGRSSIPGIDAWDLRHWWVINAGEGVPLPDYMNRWTYPARVEG